MSLEQKIEELNGTMLKLISALENVGAPTNSKAEKTTKKEKPVKEEVAKDDDLGDDDDTSEYTFDDVKSAVLKLAKVNRDEAVRILSDHGAKKATDLSEGDYGSVMAAIAEVE